MYGGNHHGGSQGASGLSGGDNADTDQRQVKGADPAGSASRNEAFWGTEKIHWQREPEGAHRPAPADGGEWSAGSNRLSRGAAAGGVHTDRAGLQLEAHSGRHVELGRRIQSKECLKINVA